eukprot:UN17768
MKGKCTTDGQQLEGEIMLASNETLKIKVNIFRHTPEEEIKLNWYQEEKLLFNFFRNVLCLADVDSKGWPVLEFGVSKDKNR